MRQYIRADRFAWSTIVLSSCRTATVLVPARITPSAGPFKDALNNSPKYVPSTTLEGPVPWPNSTLLRGDIFDGLRWRRRGGIHG